MKALSLRKIVPNFNPAPSNIDPTIAYWKQQLGGELPILQLPTDYPRPPLSTNQGATQSLKLSPELTTALKSLSQEAEATLFMTLLAAFKTLLYRYTGQADIIVGTPIANRNRRELEGIIGFFANTLALRTDVSGNPTVRELLHRVCQVTQEAYAHQDFPFEKLVEELQPQRDLSRNPLFQVMLAFQNASTAKPIPPSSRLIIGGLNTPTVTAKFDLNVSLVETPEGLRGTFTYKTDLFQTETIIRMLGHFQRLLQGFVTNPDSPITELPLLTETEEDQLLRQWNNTQTQYPRQHCVHQVFETQVEKTPDAIAVVFGEQQLTYHKLNRQANQLAHHLRSLGVKPEVCVGLYLERSIETVIGLLGILKAGGAYVPLDPTYPPERISFMLADSQVSVLLTQQNFVEQLPDFQGSIVYLDTDQKTIDLENDHNPNSGATADNLAYVIYTSGSTGKPKGVAIPHRAVNRLVLNTNYIQFKPNDRVAQASNICFDAATFEIWGTLLHGATLVGMKTNLFLSPRHVARFLQDQEITVLWLTTALFNQLTRFMPQSFKGLRYLLIGGDAADPQSVKAVLANSPPQRLLNAYGPTESTTFACCYWIQDLPTDAKTVPIGRPISNTQIYLLDSQLQPVPIGVSGELCIAGDGLARGYLNRPQLTAEKFIPNPFGAGRLYKTGDLARYRPDGNIEFLGRIDYQVKIRGFRVEPGEIEAVLLQHPNVTECVVLGREDSPGDKRLVAYIVPTQEQVLTLEELHQFLKQKLPDYMIPAIFVPLEAMPLTPNSKVDRRGLPVPNSVQSPVKKTFVKNDQNWRKVN